MNNYKKMSAALVFYVSLSATISAQSDDPYGITQSVIASGGGKSDSAPYSITGTVGQTLAGTNSSGAQFRVRGGFWQPSLAPSAAMVSISGSVLTPDGQPIGRVIIVVQSPDGNLRTAITNAFGYFRIDDIQVGQTHVLSATHRRSQFVPQAISVVDEIDDMVIRSIE